MATNQRFQELYTRLNPEQKKAVDTIDGPVMVIAGPGTGKTQILTLRIANILKETDAGPDSILALTFTESGVHAMRKRLVDIIGSAAYKVMITTFHGFANDVIKNFPEEFPRIIGANNATDIDQIRLMEGVLQSLSLERLKPYGDPLYYVRPILQEIKHLKRENIDPDELEKIVAKQQKDFDVIPDLYYEKGAYKGKMKGAYKDLEKQIEKNKELILAYRGYEVALTKERLFDFEDMIMEVVRAMKRNEDLRLRLQEKYQYVLADEHQDANQAQNSILEQLSSFHDNPNLFIVGDEKQAIFRFQGASLENFLYFKRIYPQASLISLVSNYRSHQTILDGSHSVIEKNKVEDASLRVQLQSQSKLVPEKIRIANFLKVEDEYLFLLKDIEDKIRSGISPSEIAILFRNNKDVFPLVKTFEKTAVPFSVESGQDVLSDDDIYKLLLILRAINELGNNALLMDVMFIDFLKLSHIDVFRISTYAKSQRISIYDCLRDESYLNEAGVHNVEKFVALNEKLSDWASLAKNKNIVDFFEHIVRESGFLEYILSHNGSLDKLHKLEAFFGEVKRVAQNHKEYKLRDFITYLDLLKSHKILISSQNTSESRQGVRLMTAHRSKGLEFDHVYIIGACDGHWGNKRDVKYFKVPLPGHKEEYDAIDDERRLFYVALTRARKGLTITWCSQSLEGKIDQLPSQFLEEIAEDHKEQIDVETIPKHELAVPSFSFAPQLNFGIDLKDKEFLKKLFLDQGMAVTALNNYLDCPWKWFFQNLVRIPQPQSKHQLYGTAVHETLKFFFDKYRIEEDLTKDRLLEVLEDNLRKKPFELRDYEDSLKKGREALSLYFDLYKNNWPRALLTEFTISGIPISFEGSDATQHILNLRGQLDKIELDNAPYVTVIDYKTKKPMTRNEIEGKTKNSDGGYKRQLVFYKLLLDRFEENKYTMTTGIIDFLESDTEGRFKKEAFTISQEEVDELEILIKKTAKEIYDFSFWQSVCSKKDCEFCRLRKLMEQKS
ncbi:MAG: ATP-dependent DNA helicase [Patescibacteria group bacterium]